jgi:hypothetical protein
VIEAREPPPADELFLAEIRAEFPSFRVVPKGESPFCRLLDVLLRVVTLGAQRRFLTHYHTVIGGTLYVPPDWDARPAAAKVVTLWHERVHLRQFRRYGRVGMSVLYLLPILPVGLAWGRARLEWEAYAETLRATAELYGIEAAEDPRLHEHIVRQFTSGAYGWMWPFPKAVRRWIDEELARLSVERP